ncbi:hypothetical protein OK016_22480 [Vibrio chagasii]|nr:hypothetical protein [Vibrio chagasii]
MFLFCTLYAAYIAGGGARFNPAYFRYSGIELNGQNHILLFTLLLAGVVTIGTHSVDQMAAFYLV